VTFNKIFKLLYISLKLLKKCARCNIQTKVTYSCDHTNNLDMCPECYQLVHWNLTN